MRKLLIANRGEIAVRIARTAADLGIATVAVYSEDDHLSLHTKTADEAWKLTGSGPAAYLDAEQLGAAALASGCDGLHPGYGFLSEDPALARTCVAAGVTFVGPAPETLSLLGDKGRARALARSCGVPVLQGIDGPASLAEAQELMRSLGPGGAVMVKAISGGGGRGMRPVLEVGRLEEAYERCASEALGAFGNADLYVEQLLPSARHIEVQVVGDGASVSHLWDRECSLQRNRQKVVEVAPAGSLPIELREVLLAEAVRVAAAVGYLGLGTVEFLVDVSGRHFFIEANARLQVEHTVTEAITGLDLVEVQLAIAGGATLGELALLQPDVPRPRGVALQARVNLETVSADGSIRPTGGTLTAFDPPSGPGVRVDTFGYDGYRTTSRFDSLLAKVIVHAPNGGLPAAAAKAYRALSEFRIEGVETNIDLLQTLLLQPAVRNGTADTHYIEEHAAELNAGNAHRTRFVSAAALEAEPSAPSAQVRLDRNDPLAVLVHGQTDVPWEAEEGLAVPEGQADVRAPLHGTVILVAVAVGDVITANQPIVVLEAMKMEHVINAGMSGVVRAIGAQEGDMVGEGQVLALVEVLAADVVERGPVAEVDLDALRPDLAEVIDRHARLMDAARPEPIARRLQRGQRSARHNVEDLCDPGTFVELAPLAIAARLARSSVEELIDQTPADGFLSGFGHVNGDLFPPERSRVAVMSYDTTVLAGTQGVHGHDKLDRVVLRALEWRLPTIFFTEGGGGRPGDTEGHGSVRSLRVPRSPERHGPADRDHLRTVLRRQRRHAWLLRRDHRDGGLHPGHGWPRRGRGSRARRVQARGDRPGRGDAAQRRHRHPRARRGGRRGGGQAVPLVLPGAGCPAGRAPTNGACGRGPREPPAGLRRADDRPRVADTGSVLELRREFGKAMVTALARVEGRPVGIIANNPQHLAGAIDADAADKAARFLQLCDAFDLPVVSLSDTPGNMVGPEAERTALIRHCARLFVIGANLTVPLFAVVLRKSYGLGAYAMTGGSPHASAFLVSWPTGEFGGGSIEGPVKLGYRNELAAIDDAEERRAEYERIVARAYEGSKALSVATRPHLIDDVIDPADTRRWIAAGLRLAPPTPVRATPKLSWIDTW